MTSTPDPTLASPAPGRPRRFTFHYLQIVLGVAFLLATLFVTWIPSSVASAPNAPLLAEDQIVDDAAAISGVPTATPILSRRIGIVAGHWGSDPFDPGAVCPEALGGIREVDVNLQIARKVQETLLQEGFQVDLLKEWDDLLDGYQALALISIHADSCIYVNPEARGYKIAASPYPISARLSECLFDRYGKTTSLPVHPGITTDMTNYHAFYQINPDTPAAIIEVGFLNLDRDFLVQQPDRAAQGISQGILCFVMNEPILPTATPDLATATPTP